MWIVREPRYFPMSKGLKFHEVSFGDALPIDGYGPGFFRVAGQVYKGSILVHPRGVESWQGYSETKRLVAIADDIDVLLVGTGADITHIPAKFREQLEEAGVGVEIMASTTACRTYNLLLSEGRRVALALLPV